MSNNHLIIFAIWNRAFGSAIWQTMPKGVLPVPIQTRPPYEDEEVIF